MTRRRWPGPPHGEAVGNADITGLGRSANQLINVKDPKKFSMYSIVAGLDPVEIEVAPLRPIYLGLAGSRSSARS